MTTVATVPRHPAHAPEYRAFPVRVSRAVRLSPRFLRLTFTGEALAGFGYAGLDQRVKLALPPAGRSVSALPSGPGCHRRWRRLPQGERPTVRTYTVRGFRRHTCELDIDFVLHGPGGDQHGPLSSWAARARPGDEIALLGPDRPGTGRAWGIEWAPPPTARRVLLAGDETAVPAIAAILAELPPWLSPTVCVEVAANADLPALGASSGCEQRVLVRGGPGAARGTLLEQAVREVLTRSATAIGSLPVRDLPSPDASPESSESSESSESFESFGSFRSPEPVLWDVPEAGEQPCGDLYVWMAGETGVMRRLRRVARREHRLPARAVACMGYWRQGHAETP